MTSFYDQNPSGSCYLVQIRAFDLAGISKFKKIYMKGKKQQQKDSGRSSKITPLYKCIVFVDKFKKILQSCIKGFYIGVNGRLWSAWKFSGQSGLPPEVVLFDRSALVVPFPKILVSSPTLPKSGQNFGRTVNGRLILLEFFFY